MPREKFTLVGAIEYVGEFLSGDNAPDDSSKKKFKNYITRIAKELEVNEWQALFIVAVINEGWDGFSGLDDIAEFMKCSPLRVVQHKPDIKDLLERQMVRYLKGRNAYGINERFIEAVAAGNKYVPEKIEGNLSEEDFWKTMLRLIKTYLVNMSDTESFINNVDKLCGLNGHIVFAKQTSALIEFNDMYSCQDEFTVFLLVCNKLINRNSYLDIDALEELMGEDRLQFFVNSLKSKRNVLFRDDYLQYAFDEGNVDTSKLMLTDTAVRRFFPGRSNYVSDSGENAKCEIRKPDDIAAKVLFYNEKEEADIKQLSDLLQEENYKGIKERMQARNYRSGFAALFYGAPGTGKTETVLQLAKNTGRSIFQVNFAELRSMWVGESEKNVKNLFNRYRSEVKSSELTPILLFNEADSIIGSRLASGNMRAVDKMENTIQNIILQEMETLDGIMIATTNLTQNIDKAFDRRFLYKVKFEKPSVESRTKIWKSMIEDISDDTASRLANSYDLSGGQIENVTRRNFINHLLYNHSLADYDKISDLCRSELEDSRANKRMGF